VRSRLEARRALGVGLALAATWVAAAGATQVANAQSASVGHARTSVTRDAAATPLLARPAAPSIAPASSGAPVPAAVTDDLEGAAPKTTRPPSATPAWVTSAAAATAARTLSPPASRAPTSAARSSAAPTRSSRPKASSSRKPTPKKPTSTEAPTTTAAPSAGVARVGSRLTLDGKPWTFTGFDAFGATTNYGINWGCGSPVYDLDQMFGSLKPRSVVRIWAFQALAWNNKANPQHQDFGAIDNVVQAADRHGVKLIMTLSDQSGTCDDGAWHDPAWYEGGYKQVRHDDGRGLQDRSYADYVTDIVTRYRHDPAIAFWEPVNEPEASTCSGTTGSGCFNNNNRSCPQYSDQILRGFFDAIGAQIKAIDPNHLISAGVAGGGECGVASGFMDTIAASPYVDLMTYHDYGSEATALPSGLSDRLAQAGREGKPIIVEEAGIGGGSSPCRSDDARAALVQAKAKAFLQAGGAGWLPWWYSQSPSSCGEDFGPSDPLIAVLDALGT